MQAHSGMEVLKNPNKKQKLATTKECAFFTACQWTEQVF